MQIPCQQQAPEPLVCLLADQTLLRSREPTFHEISPAAMDPNGPTLARNLLNFGQKNSWIPGPEPRGLAFEVPTRWPLRANAMGKAL